MSARTRLIWIAAVAVFTIYLWGQLAPRDQSTPVPLSTIPASVCGTFGAPTAAALVTDVGVADGIATKTYRVTCGTGAVMYWTGP